MTENIWNNQSLAKKFGLHRSNSNSNKLTSSNAKVILHNAKHKLLFRQRIAHQAQGPSHDLRFNATTTITFDRGALSPTMIPPDSCAQELPGGRIKVFCTGAARNKKRAEMLAAVDALLFLDECGIDAKDPPDFAAMQKAARRQELQAQQEQAKAQAKEHFKQKLTRAQMLLELLNASRPKFELRQTPSNHNEWIADVQIFLRGTCLTVTGPPGGSKAQAEGNALIEIVQGQTLTDIIGRDTMEHYIQLIEASPANHIAALRVSPLPEEVLMELSAIMGTKEDHAQRMQQHGLAKEIYEAEGGGLRRNHPTSRRRNRNPQNMKAINEALKKEEANKARKVAQHPDGKQAAMQSIREKLPIKNIRQDLIEALRTKQVVVVSGGTGSGKTTQCPQYILEDAVASGNGAHTQIIVTQPRKIAAISVAERVAAERDERIGNSVGYTVRFKREAPREAGGTVEFVTTGVLLRRLMNDPTLADISHVMIDEVHERDINTDFLLILLRDLLAQRPDLRVILMSATLDAESFGAYFSQEQHGMESSADSVPVLSVPTQPRHPVEVCYLEDMANDTTKDFPQDMQALAQSLLQYNDEKLIIELEEALDEETAADELEELSIREDEGEMLESDSDSDGENNNTSSSSLTRVERLRRAVSMRTVAAGDSPSTAYMASGKGPKLDNNFDASDAIVSLVTKIAQHLTRVETDAGRSGSILCFLPGWDELKEATAELEKTTTHRVLSKMNILPLHSTIPQDDQQKVFKPADPGTVKVILATNIAESSVTIDDVLAVVDSGLVREMNYDSESAMSAMETNQTSRASATQRLGRAGRVAPGNCYRIYSRGALEAMPERPTPEIQRTALEATCLQTCSITRTGVALFLSRALDPPPEEAVAFAMERLVKLGAMNVDGKAGGGEALSPLGRCLSRLPLDPATGRMLIMGVVMECLDPLLTAAACFSSRTTFYNPPGMRAEAREIRKSFCDTSDIMAMVRAYSTFWRLVDDEGWPAAKDWAFEKFVSVSAMVSIQSVRSQLLQEFNKIGMVSNIDIVPGGVKKKVLRSDATVNRNSGNDMLCSALWATAFPGNLSARRQLGVFGTLRTRMEDHAGLHPSSVAFYRKPQKGVKLPSWYLYRELVLSSQVFVRGCTAMTPEQIIVFGGYSMNAVEDSLMRSRVRGVLDDWIVVQGPCEDSMDLLINARNEINAALERKVMHPREQLPDTTLAIIDVVSEMYSMLDDDGNTEKWLD